MESEHLLFSRPRPSRTIFTCFWIWLRFNFVQLGGNDNRLVAIGYDPVIHHLVIGRRIVADINEKEDTFEHLRFF